MGKREMRKIEEILDVMLLVALFPILVIFRYNKRYGHSRRSSRWWYYRW